MTQHSKRFAILAERDINKETFVEPWAEAGLIVTDSPYDPQPSLDLEAGRVVEMDGKVRADFDVLDTFIADHALNLAVADEAMRTPSQQIARMLVDINVPQRAVRRLAEGCTPAKLCDIIRHMNVLEMMMGLGKMRVRRTPANQAHVTNWREHPALLAADAAEAALRGFAEVETTVRVARNAPFNALAILVGGRGVAGVGGHGGSGYLAFGMKASGAGARAGPGGREGSAAIGRRGSCRARPGRRRRRRP